MPHTLSTSYYRMQFDRCPFAHLHKKTIPKGQQPLGMFPFYLILSSDHAYFLYGFTNYYVVHPGLNLCIQTNGLPIGKSACHNLNILGYIAIFKPNAKHKNHYLISIITIKQL